MATKSEVNIHILDIVDELSEAGLWVTPELAIGILLDRYNASCFDELGVGYHMNIPSLRWIHDVNSKVTLFLNSFIAMEKSGSSAILCFADCHVGLLKTLRYFNVPLLRSLRDNVESSSAVDKNQIDIDEVDGKEGSPSTHEDGACSDKKRKRGDVELSEGSNELETVVRAVNDYGLGPLEAHAYVTRLFGNLPPGTGATSRFNKATVLNLLLTFADNEGSAESAFRFQEADFNSFFQEHCGKTLQDAGVCILSDTNGVVSINGDCAVSLRHAQCAYYSQLESFAKSTREEKDAVAGVFLPRFDSKMKLGGQKLGGFNGENQPHSSSKMISNESLRPLCVEARWKDGSGVSASPTDLRAVGRWGEALVFQFLVLSFPDAKITWVNEEVESTSCYDIRVEESRASSTGEHIVTTFVEVKASRFDSSKTFEISLNEWEFASGTPPINYDVYRVFNAGNPEKVRLHVIRDLYQSVRRRDTRLCISV